MASCVGNIHTINYRNLITGFQVTVENVGDFLGHSVVLKSIVQNVDVKTFICFL